jgi:hypothetical protein
VRDRVLKEGLSREPTREARRRAFLRDLGSGFVSDVLRDPAAQLDRAAPRRTVREPFPRPKDLHPAACRRAPVVRDPAFRAVPELAQTREPRAEPRCPKRRAFWSPRVPRGVRTHPQGERTHRRVRFLEQGRSQWRGRRTRGRFVVRARDRIGRG